MVATVPEAIVVEPKTPDSSDVPTATCGAAEVVLASAMGVPDVVVVLSWDYAEDIVARHRAWRAGGGRFIIPLPEITVI